MGRACRPHRRCWIAELSVRAVPPPPLTSMRSTFSIKLSPFDLGHLIRLRAFARFFLCRDLSVFSRHFSAARSGIEATSVALDDKFDGIERFICSIHYFMLLFADERCRGARSRPHTRKIGDSAIEANVVRRILHGNQKSPNEKKTESAGKNRPYLARCLRWKRIENIQERCAVPLSATIASKGETERSKVKRDFSCKCRLSNFIDVFFRSSSLGRQEKKKLI